MDVESVDGTHFVFRRESCSIHIRHMLSAWYSTCFEVRGGFVDSRIMMEKAGPEKSTMLHALERRTQMTVQEIKLAISAHPDFIDDEEFAGNMES